MTALIDSATIADLQAVDESAMPDTATITTATRVPDGGGSYTEIPTTTAVACRFWTLDGGETEGDAVRAFGKHRVALPQDTSISQTGRVTVNGRTYQVKYIFPLTGYSTSRIVGLEDAA